MKTIIMQNGKTGNIDSVIGPTDFIAILDLMDTMVRNTICDNHMDIAYSNFYDTNLFDFSENSAARALWLEAISAYYGKDINDVVGSFLAETFTKAANDCLAGVGTISRSDPAYLKATEVDVETPFSIYKAASHIYIDNAKDIYDQAIATMIANLKLDTSKLASFFDEAYWYNMECFVDSNWEDIYNHIEALQMAEVKKTPTTVSPSNAMEPILIKLYVQSGLKKGE